MWDLVNNAIQGWVPDTSLMYICKEMLALNVWALFEKVHMESSSSILTLKSKVVI